LGNAKEHEAPARSDNALQQIITPVQVAALLQVHVKTVYRLAEQGVIPGNRIGRRWRFSKRDILSLVSNKQRKTSTAGEPLGPVSRQREVADKNAPGRRGLEPGSVTEPPSPGVRP
jgi:excisionase family DNA binding protein